uniref:1-phosphatidylinositol-3-phosphate 5-kinase n=1 Tax=Ciona intestinalis TaxID=7719 RepID=F6XJV0_CIOIN
DLKQYWMPDKHCHECYECGDRFTTFRRRHHCRICGHIFCSRCCYQFIPREVIAQAGVGMLRSCTYCYSLLTSYTKPTVTNTTAKNLQILNEYDGLIDVRINICLLEIVYSTVSLEAMLLPKNLIFFKVLKFIQASHESNTSLNLQLDPFNTSFSRHPKGRSRSLVSGRGSPIEDGVMSPMQTEATRPPFNNQHEQVTFAKGSVQLHELWAKISDDKDGLEFRDHRYRLRKFTQSVTGTELVDWLITRGITETRPQGCAIAQALLDAEWIKSVVDDRVFHDEYCLYQHGTPIKQSRRPSRQSRVLSHEYGTTLDNEPNWVKEISNEEEKDSDDGLHFWSPVIHNPSLLSFRDLYRHDSVNPSQSGGSLSSYVEIDNEHKIIKYKRPSSPPPLESGLKQPKFVDENVTSISADYIRSKFGFGLLCLCLNMLPVSCVGWREKEVQTSHLPSHVKHAFYRLKKLYFRHSMKFLHQLFVREKLHTSWSDVVVPLAKQICDTVTPNAEVNMEICHYVHVKKLLDNEPQDSRLLWGVVFSHNVVHNKMMNRIDNPTIMLLATPLEYQRVQYKLSSLDPIVQQEPEFLKHLISRIVSRKPDIVMSQCSVSHEGRRLLLDAGITLIINVKQPVMERLSRCTNADVAYSIDQLKTVRLGSCDYHTDPTHSLRSESSTNAYKTLIYVDGCDPTKGCSVILRDLPHYLRRQDTDHVIQDRLSRVKRVLLFLIRIMYHGKLEISYLLDQQDVASSFPSSRKKKRCRRSKPTVAPPPIKGFSSETSGRSLYLFIWNVIFVWGRYFMTCPWFLTPTMRCMKPPFCSSKNYIGCRFPVFNKSQTIIILESEVHSAEESVVASGGFVSSVSDDNTITPDFLSANDRTPDSCPDSPLFNAAHKGATFTLPNVDKPNIEVSTELEQSKHGKVLEEKSKVFQDFLKTSLLSTSPLIQPVVPFLLTNKGPSSPLRKYLPERLFWSDSFCSNPESVKHEWVGKNEMILSVEVEAGSSVKQWQGVKHDRMTSHVRMPSQVSTRALSKPASSTQMKDLLASFRARGSNLTPATRTTPSSWGHPLLPPPPSPPTPPEDLTEPTLPPLDCLEPHNHQHIFVLFSSYSLQSPNAPYPCVIPWAVDIDYYHGNDITIGGFLERYCFRPSYHCPSPTCKRPMVEHVRSFVHGNTAMNIVLKELSKPIPVPHILSWCWDPTTKTSTDIRPLSEDGWSMSFAKFLELRLQTHPTVKQDGEVPAFGAFQYFLFKDIVAAFKCYHVQVHDVALPSSKMALSSHGTTQVGYEAMDSIQDMILDAKSSNPYDLLDVGDVGFDVGTLQQTRGNHFDELLSMYQDERCHLRDTADNIHLTLLSIKKRNSNNRQSTEESVIVMRPCEKLVLTWNNRISKVFQQDKNSRRGSKSVPSYPNPPLPLDAVLTSENLKPKRSPVLPSLFETTEAEPASASLLQMLRLYYRFNDVSMFNELFFPQDSADSIGSSYDDSALFSEKSPLTSSQSVPRVSMRSILTHLRTTTPINMVEPPFPPDEHYLLPDTLNLGHVVRDTEPSSIIAYSLATSLYQKSSDAVSSVARCSVARSSDARSSDARFSDAKSSDARSSDARSCYAKSSVASSTNISPTQAPTQPPHNPPEHLEIQFSDSTTKFYCKIYFASKFKDLREKFLDIPESTYITSLSRCVRWDARGGKSGLSFHKTLDDRLVLKQMSKFELQSFLDVAPSYLDHVSDAIRENTPTALSKILGVYRVSFRNMTTNRSFKQDLLIMENLFYKRNIQQVFDLKGSVRNRHVKTGNDPNQNDLVLLDENLLSIMKDHPLYVHQHTKVIIKKALHHDSSFLARHLIIDYSLLVGIDDEKKEIVVGIIDYMRTFTWDKKLEMVVKSYGMIGRQGTRSMPTVVSPELYKTRFCDAMERYFQVVPDRWYGLQAYE